MHMRGTIAIFAAAIILLGHAPIGARQTPQTASSLEAAAKEAEAAGRTKEAFDLYVRAVQALPDPGPWDDDVRMRERIIALASRIDPPPVVSEDAVRLQVRGQVLFKDAKDEKGFEEAASELRKAVRAAPWVGDFAYNLALVDEKLEFYKSAAANIKLYLLANPPDAADARAKLYELELRREKSQTHIAWNEDCAFGLGSACARLSKAYATGQGLPKDTARAGTLLLRACAKSDWESCGSLARYADGISKLKQLPIGILEPIAELAKQACDVGSADGCAYLGRFYAIGLGVVRDPSRAAQLYKQGCDSGSSNGCQDLASATTSPQEKVNLLERACSLGNGDACDGAATMYTGYGGIKEQSAKALPLLEKACYLGNGIPRACLLAGLYYQTGDGVKKDRFKGAALLVRACNLGEDGGCIVLAADARDAGNRAEAIKYFELSCKLGAATSCDAARRLAR